MVKRQEGDMADERDTDRLAGALMNALLGSMAKPMAGLGQSGPQVDQGSMLNTIKDFLNKEREKPEAQSQAAVTPVAAGGVEAGGWEGLFRRQAQERAAMYQHHQQEREEMHQRHLQEMEAALQGGGTGGTVAPTTTATGRTTRTTRPAASLQRTRRTRTIR
jgi:hypothetical protein